MSSWKRLFSIDARSLAVFRIVVGLLLLIDLAQRVPDARAMYSDEGMFPRSLMVSLTTTPWNWSFHMASGSETYQLMLFAVAAVFAGCLAAGFQTRLATIASWVLLVSLHHRVPPILSGAEILLRMLLFWGMFLPLGRVWSLDARLSKESPAGTGPVLVRGPGTVAILAQMGVMYLLSAIFKTNEQWLGGSALAGVLAHDFYALPAGEKLLQFPGLLKVMTWSAFGLEWAGPLLLFLPFKNALARMIAVFGLMGMHLGIAIFMDVGLFSYVAMAGLILFLPPEFWNRFATEGEAKAEPVWISARWLSPVNLFCLAAVGYVLLLNFSTLPGQPLRGVALEQWKPFERGLSLGQRWGMFDTIPSNDGWYVARARLADGSEVDLLRDGRGLDWTRPAVPARSYPSRYWTKLFREMTYSDAMGFQLYRQPVADYLCRNWNEKAPPEKQVVLMELLFCMPGGQQLIPEAAPKLEKVQLAVWTRTPGIEPSTPAL